MKLTELTRAGWDELIEKFITTPATVAQRTFEQFVPGGAKDPRLYKDAQGAMMIIGPDLPSGRKVSAIVEGNGIPLTKTTAETT